MPAITFHQSGKERLVWNPETNKAAAEFLGGEFATDDPQVQQLLRSLGYRTIEQVRAGLAEAAIPMPTARKLAVPSTEAAGADAKDAASTEPRNRQIQTAFEPPEIEAENTRSDRPQPARGRKAVAAKRVVQ